MRRFYLPFGIQVLVLLVLVSTIAISAAVYTTYIDAKSKLRQQVASEVGAIVNSLSGAISTDSHANIFFDPEFGLEGEEDFLSIQRILQHARDNNRLDHTASVSPIYTLRKTFDYDKSHALEFVVMTNPNEEGQFYTGSRIESQSWHEKVFAGESHTTDLYEDSEGMWISAAAPIKSEDGGIFAIIQVDRPVNFLLGEENKLQDSYLEAIYFTGSLTMILSLVFTIYMLIPVRKLKASANQLANQQFNHRIQGNRPDEFGDLYRAFNQVSDQLLRSSHNAQEQNKVIGKGIDKLNIDSTQMASLAEAFREILQTQIRSAKSISSQAETLNKNSEVSKQHSLDIIKHSGSMSEQIQNTLEGAQTCGTYGGQVKDAVHEVKAKLNTLSALSDGIENIGNIINQVASDTGLLALNATIEAARAGEHGRGFAVVASEVSSLAQKTMNHTQEIHKLVKEILGGMQDASSQADGAIELADSTRSSTESLHETILSMSKTIEQISSDNLKVADRFDASVANCEKIDNHSETIQGQLDEALSFSFILNSSSKDLVTLADQLKYLLEGAR